MDATIVGAANGVPDDIGVCTFYNDNGVEYAYRPIAYSSHRTRRVRQTSTYTKCIIPFACARERVVITILDSDRRRALYYFMVVRLVVELPRSSTCVRKRVSPSYTNVLVIYTRTHTRSVLACINLFMHRAVIPVIV